MRINTSCKESNYLRTTVIGDDMAALHLHNVSPVASHVSWDGKVWSVGWEVGMKQSRPEK